MHKKFARVASIVDVFEGFKLFYNFAGWDGFQELPPSDMAVLPALIALGLTLLMWIIEEL